MKKLMLVLSLLIVLGVCAPALAFTTQTEADPDIPFTLDLYLVEYEDNDLFGFASLPETDRGYAKNEVIAFVAGLYAPKGENPYPRYRQIIFTGENVEFTVTDNTENRQVSDNVGSFVYGPNIAKDEIIAMIGPDTFSRTSAAQTYRLLFFAKITGEDAFITCKLSDGDGNTGYYGPNILDVDLKGIHYWADKYADPDSDRGYYYQIAVREGDYQNVVIILGVDKHYVSTYMQIFVPDRSAFYGLGLDTNGEIGVLVGSVLETSGKIYDEVMEIYEEVVIGVFGLDFHNRGNYLRPSYFEALVSPDTLVKTVDIKPYTAYVAAPDHIVTDPPKTGGAAGMQGFAMVALAGAGAVLLRKRG